MRRVALRWRTKTWRAGFFLQLLSHMVYLNNGRRRKRENFRLLLATTEPSLE